MNLALGYVGLAYTPATPQRPLPHPSLLLWSVHPSSPLLLFLKNKYRSTGSQAVRVSEGDLRCQHNTKHTEHFTHLEVGIDNLRGAFP